MLDREGSYGITFEWVVILKIWKICNAKPMIGVCCEGKLVINVEV
jgi:hypothetical protein